MGFRIAVLKGTRWILWLFMALIMIRGVASIIVPPRAAPAEAAAPAPVAQPAADREAPAAVAALFAREYLTWQTGQEADRAARLAPWLSKGLDPQAGWTGGEKAAPQVAEATWPYRVVEVEAGRWLVTVAARVTAQAPAGAVPRTVYLAVPVAGGAGGYAVADYPTIVPAPAAPEASAPAAGDSFTDPDGQIRTLLNGFFKAYAAGGEGDVTYFLEPGFRLRGLEGTQVFEGLADLTLRKREGTVWVTALVNMKDPVTEIAARQRYTVEVTQRDGRWYVKQIVQKGA